MNDSLPISYGPGTTNARRIHILSDSMDLIVKSMLLPNLLAKDSAQLLEAISKINFVKNEMQKPYVPDHECKGRHTCGYADGSCDSERA